MNSVRQVTRHHVEPGRADMGIQITAQGPYGPGGDQSQYVVTSGAEALCHVQFQQGNPAEYGVNGVSLEALLAICLDRLDHLQRGPYANPYNEHARLDIERAIESLNDRVRERDWKRCEPS